MGLFGGHGRQRVAVVVTTDGRRVQVPLDPRPELSLLVLLRSLGLGLEGLRSLLITGLRREGRGTRRNG